MNIGVALLLIALGMVVEATHSHIRRESERQAYHIGYQQAQKEEQIRLDASKPVYRKPVLLPADCTPAQPVSERHNVISEEFMDHLRKNRCASTQIHGEEGKQ